MLSRLTVLAGLLAGVAAAALIFGGLLFLVPEPSVIGASPSPSPVVPSASAVPSTTAAPTGTDVPSASLPVTSSASPSAAPSEPSASPEPSPSASASPGVEIES